MGYVGVGDELIRQPVHVFLLGPYCLLIHEVYLYPSGCNFEGKLQPPQFGGLWGRGGRGCPIQVKVKTTRPWVPISSPMTHMIYLFAVFELLGCSPKAFPPARLTWIR